MSLDTQPSVTAFIQPLFDDVIKWKLFCVTGPLLGKSIGHRWIPLTKACGADL